MPHDLQLRPKDLLCRQPERPLGVHVPVPLSARVDELVDLVELAGERTSRKEMVAAILHSTPAEGRKLKRLLQAFRQATVEDAVIGDGVVQGNVVRFPIHRPGPRRKAN
jgi:hypothetical protein